MKQANVMRAPSAPKMVTQSQPQFSRSAPVMRSRPETTFTPSMARTRSFERQGKTPGIAFGGHVIDNNNNTTVSSRNSRTFTTTPSSQFTTRSDSRDFRPPNEMSRDWDRGRVHEWNRHHYRFYGGNWVIIDPGYAYDYGYGYDYDEPTTYSSPAYSYDYSSSESLAASVQGRLAHLGYSPGPVDGVIGPQTRDALADFQGDNRLPVTGQIDTATLRALGL